MAPHPSFRLSWPSTLARLSHAPAGKHMPAGAYQVHFPRLDLVLSNRYHYSHEGCENACLSAQEALFIPAEHWTLPNWCANGEVLHILFDYARIGFSLVRSGPQGVISTHKESMVLAQRGSLNGMLDVMAGLCRDGAAPEALRFQGQALLALLQALYDEARDSQWQQGGNQFRAICLYISEHLYAPLTREDVSLRFGISTTHLSRLFRQHLGHGFCEFLAHARLDLAKALLRQGQLPLSAVAGRCGYVDVNYFHRVFKQRFAITPCAYRREFT
ncbi:AraC family transcriptional regulator [Chromobacterium sp. TRC.1.1.SA]|uniref:AraC family transcriptional regulator n=1 Tax=Chromobacterium indicum TaxID=3110228 RepID=A0ABV0CEB7_9NEIS